MTEGYPFMFWQSVHVINHYIILVRNIGRCSLLSTVFEDFQDKKGNSHLTRIQKWLWSNAQQRCDCRSQYLISTGTEIGKWRGKWGPNEAEVETGMKISLRNIVYLVKLIHCKTPCNTIFLHTVKFVTFRKWNQRLIFFHSIKNTQQW